MTSVETLARTAAQRAWAEHRARAPRYPGLPAWMALAAALRRDGQADRLNRDTHQLFVTAYLAELEELTGGARCV